MFKIIRFVFSLIITYSLFYYFNYKQGDIPPLGKFLSPYTGFWLNGEKEDLKLSESLDVSGLKEEVTITFDEQLFPHVFAQNDYDLYFAQGYITAYHRLWQMEFQLLKTAGRLSEVLGDVTINLDKTQRRKGLVYGAKRSLEAMQKNPEILNMTQGYTDGVNYLINSLDYEDYPIEYKLLDYKPEPWTNLKACLLLKEMADQLSRGEADLQNTNALKLFGRADFDLLFPERHPDLDPVVPNGTKWDFEPIEVVKPDVEFPQIFTKNTIPNPDPRNGSNSFVVDGSKTANGKVLLANEPDLSLNLPSIWYVMQLNAPGINVFGATLPGSPGVTIGFNDSIAWGNTNAKRDLVDWYYIEFKNDRREEYRYDNKWLKTEKQIEAILVRNGETIYDTIVYTHYGPVAYDNYFLGNGQKVNYSMKWTAHEGSQELNALYKTNRAQNYDEFVDAFKYFTGPPQNYSFASTTGDIAVWVNGKFPVKWEEQGKFLLDGRDSRQEWQATIPHEQNIHVKNPPEGFVSSANQHPSDSTYPYYSYDYRFEYYRNRRINDRLKLLQNMRVQDMMKLQNDNYNYKASESLSMMLDSLDTASMSKRGEETLTLLRKWDYFNEPDRKAPAVFKEWSNLLYESVWDEFENQDVALIRPNKYHTIYLLKNNPNNKFIDDKRTEKVETVKDLINQSFYAALDTLDKWKEKNNKDYIWYEYKNTRVTHLMRLAPFSVDHVKIGGDNNIVNAASGKHGPSWRMVVELGDGEVNGWGVYPGSQTGNPGNPTYANMIENWAEGQYFPLVFLRSVEEKNDKLIFTQTLKPN